MDEITDEEIKQIRLALRGAIVNHIENDKKENVKKELVRQMLFAIGENPDRPGLEETPDRVVKMWKEIFKGYDINNKPKITVFDNGDDGIRYDEMISDEGGFHSHCEHHMLVISGKYWFAYIPHPQGKVLGLSKIGRVVDYFSAKLQVQERLTHEIVEYLWTLLCDEKICKHPPIGMGLVLEAEHLCKTMRGVKKKGNMRTTILKGSLKTEPAARMEFMNWVNRK